MRIRPRHERRAQGGMSIKAHEREIDDETLKKVPDELDLTASRNERDFQKLRQMIAAIRAEA